MTDQSMREAIDEVWALFRKTDAQIKETDAMLAREHALTEAQRVDQRPNPGRGVARPACRGRGQEHANPNPLQCRALHPNHRNR